jgi:5-methylcytosine-specific restriction endonuclease McrA
MAEMIFLKLQLIKEGFEIKRERKFIRRNQWVRFRNNWMRKYQREHTIIKCVYCGKEHLDPWAKEDANKATIDHLIPKSKGGKVLDEENFVIACFKCNQDKGNKVSFNVEKIKEIQELNDLKYRKIEYGNL